MHKAPTVLEKYLYTKSGRALIYGYGSISTVLLLCGLFLFAGQSKYLYLYFIYGGITALYLGISYYIGIFGKNFSLALHEKTTSNTINYLPTIDIFLPSCGEEIAILRNTMEYVSKLEWKGIKNVYCLDDKGSDVLKKWAEHFGFHYICRENRPELKKAGNLRNAFKQTTGELFVVFDADFCPSNDFLKETIPYFRDEKIAIVQTSQYFTIEADHTEIEKGATFIQELFYRLIQVNRETFNGAICVGTNAVYRRSVFEDLGGTYPIDYSEDIHTGFYAVSKGYQVKYIPLNLAKGINPPDHKAFFVQQYRWCMGSTTLFINPWFWKTKLGINQRLCYLSGMLYYSTTAIGVLLAPIPAIIMANFFPERVFWYNYLFSFPSFIFTIVIWGLWSRAPFGLYALKSRIIQYWAHLFSLVDLVRNQKMPWIPTGDVKKESSNKRFSVYKNLSFIHLIGSYGLIAYGICRNINHLNWYHFIPMMGFSAFWAFVTAEAWDEI